MRLMMIGTEIDFEDGEIMRLRPSSAAVERYGDLVVEREIMESETALPAYSNHAFALLTALETACALPFVDGGIEQAEGELILERANFLIAHAFIRADEPMMTRILLPTVKDPAHKVALYEAATIANNEASLEVLAAYEAKATLETELQRGNYLEELANLMCLKIAAGQDIYTSVDKLKQLESIGVKPERELKYRMINEFLRTSDLEPAPWLKQISFGEDTLLCFAYYLRYGDKGDSFARDHIEAMIQELPRKYDRKVFRRILNESSIETVDGRSLVRIGKNNGEVPVAFLNRLKQAMEAGPQSAYVSMKYQNARHASFNALSYTGYSDHRLNPVLTPIWFDQALIDYTGSYNDPQVLSNLVAVSAELIGVRAERPSTGRDGLSTIVSELGVLYEERQPSEEHFLMNDYYARQINQKQVVSVLTQVIDIIKAIANPLEQYEAIRTTQAFCEGAYQDIAEQKAVIDELERGCRHKLMHPVLQNILGIQLDAVEPENAPN